jgi:hypothetical protein
LDCILNVNNKFYNILMPGRDDMLKRNRKRLETKRRAARIAAKKKPVPQDEAESTTTETPKPETTSTTPASGSGPRVSFPGTELSRPRTTPAPRQETKPEPKPEPRGNGDGTYGSPMPSNPPGQRTAPATTSPTPSGKPKRSDFPAGRTGAAKYNAAMAAWRKKNTTKPKPRTAGQNPGRRGQGGRK